jgi:RNA polymerase sigma-70 factor (ECF subfamily)
MDAFDILAEQYRPMIMTYIQTLVRDANLAEDLAQETLIAAYREFSNFEPNSKFGAWLRGIARNKVLQNHRATSRRRIVTDSRIVEGMEEVYSNFDLPTVEAESWSERLNTLRDCVTKLSGSLREAVAEVYEKGYTLKQAALRLNMSFEALAQRLHRSRILLHKCVLDKNTQELGHARR